MRIICVFLIILSLSCMGIPSPVSPEEGGTVDGKNVVLEWEDIEEPVVREVELSTSPDFAEQNTTRFGKIYSSKFTVFDLLKKDTLWFWRVRSSNKDKVFSPWSDAGSFRVERPLAVPELVLPDDNAILMPGDHALIWKSIKFAETYTIEIHDNPSCENTPVFSKTVNTGKVELAKEFLNRLEKDKNYFWRVRSRNVENEVSDWSPVYSFLTPSEYVVKADDGMISRLMWVPLPRKGRVWNKTIPVYNNLTDWKIIGEIAPETSIVIEENVEDMYDFTGEPGFVVKITAGDLSGYVRSSEVLFDVGATRGYDVFLREEFYINEIHPSEHMGIPVVMCVKEDEVIEDRYFEIRDHESRNVYARGMVDIWMEDKNGDTIPEIIVDGDEYGGMRFTEAGAYDKMIAWYTIQDGEIKPVFKEKKEGWMVYTKMSYQYEYIDGDNDGFIESIKEIETSESPEHEVSFDGNEDNIRINSMYYSWNGREYVKVDAEDLFWDYLDKTDQSEYELSVVYMGGAVYANSGGYEIPLAARAFSDVSENEDKVVFLISRSSKKFEEYPPGVYILDLNNRTIQNISNKDYKNAGLVYWTPGETYIAIDTGGWNNRTHILIDPVSGEETGELSVWKKSFKWINSNTLVAAHVQGRRGTTYSEILGVSLYRIEDQGIREHILFQSDELNDYNLADGILNRSDEFILVRQTIYKNTQSESPLSRYEEHGFNMIEIKTADLVDFDGESLKYNVHPGKY